MSNNAEAKELAKLKKLSRKKYSKFPKILKIIIAGILTLATIITCLVLANSLARANQVTNAVKSHVAYKDFFTPDKLKSSYEQDDFNPTADGKMGGTFQLTESESKQLLNSKTLLVCARGENCQISQPRNQEDGKYCGSARSLQKRAYYDICVDPSSDQVEWSTTFY